MDIYPLKFEPVILEKIWGGTDFCRMFPGKGVSSDIRAGEIWEIAARKDCSSVVANGPLAGKTLSGLVAEHGNAIAGERALDSGKGRFPLLYKFLDAADQLSVQVHPDDGYAEEHENDLGKMEAWYILDADKDARIVKGLKPGFDREDFKKLLEEGKLDECLNMFGVASGDVVFIPPRTLHTIGGRIVLFEIQQNSDVTFRAYDWGRTGTDGKPRQLHIDQVFDVADFNPPLRTVEPVERPDTEEYTAVLVDCPYFILEEAKIVSGFEMCAPADRFLALTVVKGEGTFVHVPEVVYRTGDTVLIPPGLECTVQPDAKTVMLVSYVPPAADWYRRSG